MSAILFCLYKYCFSSISLSSYTPKIWGVHLNQVLLRKICSWGKTFFEYFAISISNNLFYWLRIIKVLEFCILLTSLKQFIVLKPFKRNIGPQQSIGNVELFFWKNMELITLIDFFCSIDTYIYIYYVLHGNI